MADIAASMRAVIIERLGKARVLIPTRLASPQPTARQALVKVHAASVNQRDVLLRRGDLVIRKPLPHILGGDLAGEIVALGDEVEGWRPGDRVCAAFEGLGCAIDGGYAEYCALPAKELARLPDELDYQTAVAAGASFAQAYLALASLGRLTKSDALVIRGAAGGIGRQAVQIAAARKALVIAISASEFAADLREIGAGIVLEDAGADLLRQVRLATDENGASIVLHCADRLDLDEALDMLRPGGRLVLASALNKPRVRLDARQLYLRQLSLQGAYGSLDRKDFEAALRGFASGRYRALIDEVMPLSKARHAHEKLEKSPGFGTIILVPDAILEAEKKPDNWIPID